MAIKRHSHVYQAGPTFPDAVGDRYYAQDLFRDQNFIIDDAGQKVASGYAAFPVLIKDSAMTKGTNWDDLDIPIAKGIVEFEVDVPNSYAALPPTVTQEDIYCRIETTAETDFDISGATLDGVTVNYVKVTYNETDGSSRTRAKKAGSYVYEKAVSYTITVSSAAPTNKDLVLGTVVGDGATFLTIVSYPRTRHLNSAFDYVVSSQEEFNVIIDRTAANQYRIKDNIKSVYVKYLSGGYQMTGATSPLQGGDAYGYIETNDCTKIIFEPGAFIDMHQNIGYIEVDTDYCFLENVSVQGDKGAASAIVRSFLLNANNVTYINCESKTRLSNTDIIVFEGSGTALHNKSSKLIGCRIEDIDTSGDITGFRYHYNIENILIYDIASTGGDVYCFRDVYNSNNIYIEKIDATGVVYGLYQCYIASNLNMTDFDSSASNIYGMRESNNITNCRMEDFDAVGTYVSGAWDCDQISNIYVYDIQSATNATGFQSCEDLNGCYAETIDSGTTAVGFSGCEFLSGCTATDCITGFLNSSYISSSVSKNNDSYGFQTCYYISVSQAIDNGSHGFYNSDTCIGCASITNTGNGFDTCNHLEHNRSTGNAAQYNNSFADFAGTRAAAATDAGGENA